MTKLMLCGCTRGDAASLLPLAMSWLRAPRMTCNGTEVPYDVTQRAYVCEISSRGASVSFRLEASSSHPVCGLCLILPGIGTLPASVMVDGKPLKDFKAGVHQVWDGAKLLLWLPVSATSPVEITLSTT